VNDLATVAPAFVEMAHRIVWCSAASVDRRGRPRSRILHPVWEWRDGALVGWVGTAPTPLKRAHLDAHPHLSMSYWDPSQDTCVAECRARLCLDLETRERVWRMLAEAPPPVGYDPAIIPGWTAPSDDAFAALRLDPWRLRVFPGTMLLEGRGELLVWEEGRGPGAR
jgi:hypothetical protein